MRKHGLYGTPLYNVWHGMKSRCYQQSNKKSFHDYGGRGITICDRWLSLDNFVADMQSTYFKGATIERKDVDGPYSPENCIWATKAEQARNKRSNVPLTLAGKTQCIAAWAIELGIDAKTLYSRVSCGWPDEKVLTTPVRALSTSSIPKTIEFSGKSQSLRKWATELGFSYQTLIGRIVLRGWTVERAFTTPPRKIM